MSMPIDLCDQSCFFFVSRIFLPLTILFVMNYDLQAEKQLVPIFHDNEMRQQVSIWSDVLLF
jgi:hypothetical protein